MYECKDCSKFFNVFTRSVFQGTPYACSVVVMLLRGVAPGVSSAQVSKESGIDYSNLLKLRHQLQENADENRASTALSDPVRETDEMFQNAGQKGKPHPLPGDPPRRRATKKKGHGTYQNDRPAILGRVGRESGQIRLAVSRGTTGQELEALVLQDTLPLNGCNTDEWKAYSHLSDWQRVHKTVNHGQKQWAKDEDGDGIQELHTNTIEGMWTGWRNFLSTFRGVCKW